MEEFPYALWESIDGDILSRVDFFPPETCEATEFVWVSYSVETRQVNFILAAEEGTLLPFEELEDESLQSNQRRWAKDPALEISMFRAGMLVFDYKVNGEVETDAVNYEMVFPSGLKCQIVDASSD